MSASSCCSPACCADQTEGASEAPAAAATSTLSADAVRASVRAQYAAIATGEADSCGCAPTCCEGEATTAETADLANVNFIGDGYGDRAGYVPDADLHLGCGIPTDLAALQPGETVLDLGSGAGVDAFVARRIVGETGTVLGVDMTPEMVEKARANATTLGYTNVAFRLGEIEAMPVADASIDVAISNCVLNLVPDKPRAFAEMARVLKPGGRFCVSDVVTRGALPGAVQRSAELWAGCVAGAMDEAAYVTALSEAGFEAVAVRTSRRIDLPDVTLATFLSADDIAAYRASGGGLFSVTVTGTKPTRAKHARA